VDETDANTLYVGAHVNGLNPDLNFGWGVYKSTDGGATFTILPQTTSAARRP